MTFKVGDIVIGTNSTQWAYKKPFKIHEVREETFSDTSYILYDMEDKEVMDEAHWYERELRLVTTKIKEWRGLI